MKLIWRIYLICLICFGCFTASERILAMNTESKLDKVASSTKELKTKRVYSIVYDDSGSMSSREKTDWARANYAFQIMSAFMNDEDEVYVTRLSAPKVSYPLEYFHYDRQVSIDYFRTAINREGSTPLEAIETAVAQLTKIENTDPTVKHWLVIITDGGFKYNGAWLTSTEQFKEYLDLFLDVKLANGTKINTAYLAINDEAMRLYQDPVNNLYTFDCKSESIVDSMVEVATLITGKYHVNKENIRIINEYELEIDLPMESFDITVLTQNSSNRLKKCSKKGKELFTDINVSVMYPEFKERVTDKSLLGCVATVSSEDDILEPGTYRFEFEEPLNENNLELYGTLALNLQLECKNNKGEYFTDLSQTYDNDTLDAKGDLYIYGTDRVADLSILKEKVQYSTTYRVNDDISNFTSEEDMQLNDLLLESSFTSVESRVQIGEFFYVNTFINGTPIKTFSYLLKAKTEGEPIYKSQLVNNLSQGVVFEVFDREKQILDKDELRRINLKFEIDGLVPLMHTYSEIRDDGTIICYPQFGINPSIGGMVNWLSAWVLASDKLTVRGYLELPYGGVSEAVGYIALKEDVKQVKIIHILLPIIVVFLFLGYFVKIRFDRYERLDWIYMVKDRERYYSGLQKWMREPLGALSVILSSYRSLIPFIRNQKRVENFICYPSGKYRRDSDSIYIRKDNIPSNAQRIDLNIANISIHDGVYITKEMEGISDIPDTDKITLHHKQGIILWHEDSAVLFTYVRKNKMKQKWNKKMK